MWPAPARVTSGTFALFWTYESFHLPRHTPSSWEVTAFPLSLFLASWKSLRGKIAVHLILFWCWPPSSALIQLPLKFYLFPATPEIIQTDSVYLKTLMLDRVHSFIHWRHIPGPLRWEGDSVPSTEAPAATQTDVDPQNFWSNDNEVV